MDSLLHSMVKLGFGEESTESAGQGQQPNETTVQERPSSPVIIKPKLLQVEQVKIVDSTGKLYTVYPSRVDLLYDDINVTREKD